MSINSKPLSFDFSSMDLQIIKYHSLTVTVRNSVKFQIMLHKMWKNHSHHQDYLGFYILDSHLLSNSVHGLLGKFWDIQYLKIAWRFQSEVMIGESDSVYCCQQRKVQKKYLVTLKHLVYMYTFWIDHSICKLYIWLIFVFLGTDVNSCPGLAFSSEERHMINNIIWSFLLLQVSFTRAWTLK